MTINYHNSIKLERPVFLIGMPRSGTTAISQALSVHEHFGWFSNYFEWLPYLPQITLLTRIIKLPYIGKFLLGKKSQETTFNSKIRMALPYCSESYSVWTRYANNNFALHSLSNITPSHEEKIRIRKIVKKTLLYQNKKQFFAKLTGPSRIFYLNNVFPSSIFIHVIRDPRANVSSLLNVSFWKKGKGDHTPWWYNVLTNDLIQKWEANGSSPVELAAIQWDEIVKNAWTEKSIIESDRFIELRYEDFVKNPYSVVNDIFTKIRLPQSDGVLHFLNKIGQVKNMNYKFKQNLSESDIRTIEKITYKTANKAGYTF